VKRGGDRRLNHPLGIGDLAGRVQAVTVENRGDQTVVRQNKVLALLGFDRNCPSGRTHARIDDDEEDRACGIVRGDAEKKAGGLLNRIRRDLMGDVRKAYSRGDAINHRAANSHRVVGRAEIGHEHDSGRIGGAGLTRAGGCLARTRGTQQGQNC